MAGLDHNRSNLETREMFALNKENAAKAQLQLKASFNVGGCVVISTCNRTELYASVNDSREFSAAEALFEVLNMNSNEYGRYFTERKNEEAFMHLCRVASGIDSQIMGDDQIITQAREALELARSIKCTDSYMETMFKRAIQAAKAIKTNVVLKSLGIDSVPGKTVAKLKELYSLSGMAAVVIGNGQIGRLVAERLLREKARVMITLREYKKGIIVIPDGADTIDYGERYSAIEQADLVVSATSSPHYTITRNDYDMLPQSQRIMVDLAVPRDIEPSIRDVPGVALLTIDDISFDNRRVPSDSIAKIERIISEHADKYCRWKAFKERGAT